MKVLVTGASGYIGSRLTPQLLAAGHSVRVLARVPAAPPVLDGIRCRRPELGPRSYKRRSLAQT